MHIDKENYHLAVLGNRIMEKKLKWKCFDENKIEYIKTDSD